jgi:PAS domain S-box-containing protein
MAAVTAAIPHAVLVVDMAGNVRFANDAAQQRGSAQCDEPEPRMVQSFFPCLGERIDEAVRTAVATSSPVFLREEGEESLMFSVWPLQAHGRGEVRAVVVALPTRGVPESELELRESEERYRKLVELLPDAIMVHVGGRVVYINAAGVRLWGAPSSDDVEGRPHIDLIHPDDREFVRQRVHQIDKGDKSPLREYRILRLDGGVVHVEAAGTAVTYRGEPANLVMFRDITLRKEAEEKLRENISRYRSLFVNSPIALWEEDWSDCKSYLEDVSRMGDCSAEAYLADPDAVACCYSFLRLKDANRACVEFYGARDKLELMAHMEQLFPEELSTIRSGLVAMAAGKRVVATEGVTRTIMGEKRDVIYHFTLSPGYEDNWAKVIVSVIDLTSQKQAERSLRAVNERLQREEAQRRRLSQRLMEMSENDRRNVAMELHDHFGQMISTQKMDLELIASNLSDADPSILARVHDAIGRATQTINDLKGFAAGLMPSMIENLGLVPSLQALVDDVRGRTGMDIQFFSNLNSERLQPEKELALYRIVQEGLNNVVKHAGARRVFVNLIRQEDALSVSIEDNGVGFAYSEGDYRLWSGGPLGLHIMRERVVQFGGELTIDSRPGEGTHILAEIPLESLKTEEG